MVTRRLYSRPVNFVAPWTYDTIGDRKRAVAARAEESGYLSGMKDEGGHHPRERRHGVRCGARAGGYDKIGQRKREEAAFAEEN